MFRTLGEALQTAIAKGMVDTGEAGIAVPAVSQKGPERYAPAKFTKPNSAHRETDPAGEYVLSRGVVMGTPPINGRRRPAQSPTSAPPLSAGRRLVLVWDSGRSPAGRSNEAPTFRRNAPGERLRETGLRLVSG